MKSKARIIGLVSVSALVAACGGGGSSDSSTAATPNAQQSVASTESTPSTPALLSFSGVVATGAPLTNAQVIVKCMGGTATASTDQSGNFLVQVVNASLPCVAQATSGTVALYSATDKQGTLNITTLTDLMMASLARTEPSSFFGAYDSTAASLITTLGLQVAQSRVRLVLPYMPLSNKIDFVATKFVADGKDPMDAVMDVIGKGYDAVGKAALRRDLAGIETLRYGGSFKDDFNIDNIGYANSITVDPKQPRKFYLNGTVTTPIYTNGGTLTESKPLVMVADYRQKTLQQFSTSGSALSSSMGFTLDPNTPDRFLRIGVMTNGTTAQMVLNESNDYGLTWQQVSAANGFQAITPPIELNVRYLRFSADGAAMFAYSTEEGSSLSAGIASYIATSVNGGATWQRPQGFTDRQVGPIYVSPADPAVVYALNDGRFLRSSDKGLTFTELPALPNSSYYTPSPPIAVDPFDANTLYFATYQSASVTQSNASAIGIFKSSDGGQSWKSLDLSGCCDTYLPALLGSSYGLSSTRKAFFSSTIKGLIYFPVRADTSSIQMLRSADGGATWKLLSFFKPASTASVASTAELTQATNTVYFGGNYMPMPIYSTAAREDGGVDVFMRAFDGKGIERYIDYLGTK